MTTQVTLEQAQAKLEELIEELSPGDSLVITKNNAIIATLARMDTAEEWPCKAGSEKDTQHWMAPDFDAPLEDFKEYME